MIASRYGGEYRSLYHKSRKTSRIPTCEEMVRFQKGNTEGYDAEEVIALLLNYVENLHRMIEEGLA